MESERARGARNARRVVPTWDSRRVGDGRLGREVGSAGARVDHGAQCGRADRRFGDRRVRRTRCGDGGRRGPGRWRATASRVRDRRRGCIRRRAALRRCGAYLRRGDGPRDHRASRRCDPGRGAARGRHAHLGSGNRRAGGHRRRQRRRRGRCADPRRAERCHRQRRRRALRAECRRPPPHVRVRRHRLRIVARHPRSLHGLPRHGLRRALRVRHQGALSRCRRNRRRVAP